ncbi:lytic transglycosylase [Halorhodospira abdelmalekii]|uniref:lytic murein transglycosylase n=1 Tax=Halorhodospira abdelmalekii TaxID=421629 RepID=UPI0019088B33|nr:lytic murein transglycosylase [Halorhodospira abdelmalekii]MBK1733830.1 lytic transglycosylase [Halorhodospira abdelmalekii]
MSAALPPLRHRSHQQHSDAAAAPAPRPALRLALATAATLAALATLTLSPPLASASSAQSTQDDDPALAQCLLELRSDLEAAGYDADLVRDTLAQAKRLERIVALDRAQPESVQYFTDYLAQRVTAGRIERGRFMYQIYEELLWKIYSDYEISPRYLVALWGMETHYGSYFGRVPVIDALVTLACDDRRPRFFREQIEATIALLERGDLHADDLYGSWAGAIGHTQFMPSTMRAHAVDYDGSGRIELRDSVPDALASAANYLQHLGWRPGERWGREVKLSNRFNFKSLGLDERRPLNEWSELGIRRADGSRLPESTMEAALLLPMGRHGPAFLVYDNFDRLLRWNPSQSFALAVGHLADRIDGSGPLRAAPPPEEELLDLDELRETQERLNALGYEAGPVDGILGQQTRNATRAFQQENGLPADAFPDRAVLEALREAEQQP